MKHLFSFCIFALVKKKVLHSIFSIVLMVIIILPFTIQMLHTLHGHTHEVCNTKDIQHIHQHQSDCSNYHQIIEQNSIDFSSEFSLEINIVYKHYTIPFYQSQYSISLQQKSSRAPPYFIV